MSKESGTSSLEERDCQGHQEEQGAETKPPLGASSSQDVPLIVQDWEEEAVLPPSPGIVLTSLRLLAYPQRQPSVEARP